MAESENVTQEPDLQESNSPVDLNVVEEGDGPSNSRFLLFH